jgi:hypothetical protein
MTVPIASSSIGRTAAAYVLLMNSRGRPSDSRGNRRTAGVDRRTIGQRPLVLSSVIRDERRRIKSNSKQSPSFGSLIAHALFQNPWTPASLTNFLTISLMSLNHNHANDEHSETHSPSTLTHGHLSPPGSTSDGHILTVD